MKSSKLLFLIGLMRQLAHVVCLGVCWRVCWRVCESLQRVCLTALTITTINLNKPKRQFASDIAHKSWRLQRRRQRRQQRQRQQLLRHLIMAFEINTCPSTHTHIPIRGNTCGRDPEASASASASFSSWASACRSVVSVYVVVSSHVLGQLLTFDWDQNCAQHQHIARVSRALLFC